MMTTKITTKHMEAIARHIADVLGDADTSRAEMVLTALIGDAPVYADLRGWDTGDVSVGLTQAGVIARVLTPKIIAALFGLVRSDAPTCNRCGRLAVRLEGSTWVAVLAPTCPVDAGLYEAPRAAPTVRGWHDGREYPEGSTHDPEGVPLDSSTIRLERDVSPMVDAALRETGATLLDVLAALVDRGAAPAEALTAVGEPLRKWVSVVALRAFVAGAKGAALRERASAVATSGRGGDPPSGSVQWQRLTGTQWKELHLALLDAFRSESALARVARNLGENLHAISAGALDQRVHEFIQWSQSRGRTRDLVIAAREENATNYALLTFAAKGGL